ncbi:MAG TPA: hypothetical protein VNU84_02330 [Candidatus Acidoferrum sp.]|jgi:protein-S-isoprenylcysteine O-methyltransferase Ste14|nr:hypothetical protein [Candidatus Acidoferrum sp.]
MSGSALATGPYAAVLDAILFVVIFAFKARKQETLLAGEFGAAFDDHREHTDLFLPKLFGAR